ncbi:MAG: DUF1549 domain-containing protein [Acidobacteria bacterium]|nr:DUF1549 domain-containing protein [Acidobacteriota bacterium]
MHFRSAAPFLLLTIVAAAQPRKLTILPANPLLFGQGAKQQTVVLLESANGKTEDVTADASFASTGAAATVSAKGQVIARANGAAKITAQFKGLSATTTALIQQAETPVKQSFAADILPVLTKYGCNGGSCHGALNGQKGFKLSLFGYEPAADYEMIVAKHDGRRIDKSQPANSLLLKKPSYTVPHGGGKLFNENSADYQTLLTWIANGAPRDPKTERQMVSLHVVPEMASLIGPGAKRKLLVTARFDDGSEADVSNIVKYSSNDDTIASVSLSGTVTAARGGETAVVVRGPGVTAAARIAVIPSPQKIAVLPVGNFIDEHINTKLQRLSIAPSELCDDATFLRRAHLDIIGLIPTAAEARVFLASTDPSKRAKLVDSLLTRPEYADYWALYWGDHLDNTKQLLYNKGPYSFTRWLTAQFEKNVPYDQFVRNLLVSSGNMYDHPATNYYPLMKKELDLAEKTSQLFLGISIGCARCHNHPLEKWKQDDFNGMAAFFSQVRYKGGGPRNNERALYVDFDRQFQNPDSKKAFLPKPLDGPYMPSQGLTDRRELLANWITAKGNRWFARAIANRMWRNFMGRGFVEPIDDFRITNPPTNEPLLAALAQDFADHNFDLHHLIRRITSSSAYQLSSVPNKSNKQDTMAYSRYYPKRLSAEPLLDSLSLAAASPEHFQSMYPGTRATQLPEPEIESYFLEVFDRPSRQLVCERKNTPTLNQALHMIGGDTAHRKASDPRGFIAKNLTVIPDDNKMIEELYLRALARFPDAEERANAANAVRAAKSRQQGFEDVLWALLNTKEFLYNH